MMGSKTSRLMIRPGMTSSPKVSPIDGSFPSSGLKQLNRNEEAVSVSCQAMLRRRT